MAGGGGSTGGIGAQSPAVNPPNPMGQIGDAVGGALGGMGGQPQNPMGGGNFVQTGQFGSQPIDMGGFGGNMGQQQTMPYQPHRFGGDMGGGEYSPNPMGGLERPQVSYFGGSTLSNMGNNTRLGNNMGQQQTMPYQPAIGMPGGQGGQTTYGNIARPPAQSYDQYLAGRSPMQQDMQLTQDQFQRQNQMGSMMGQQQALQQAMQRQYAQPGQDYRTVSPQQMDQMRGLSQQMDSYMQTSPAMKQMQDLQAKIQSGQLTPEAGQAQGEALNAQLRDYQQNSPMMQQFRAMQQAGQMSPDMQQANAQRAFDQRQSGMGQQQMPSLGQQLQSGIGRQPTGQTAGLGALLGGMPNQPTPTAPPVSTTQPAPVAARPAPVAAKPAPTRAAPAKPMAKPMAKPSVVPPKTPPAVASAIQKLAAKKQNRR